MTPAATMIVLNLGAAPTPPLSLNTERTMHWAARNRRLHPWRDLTWALALKADLRRTVAGSPARITACLPVSGAYRRDPANYYPTVKACVDGLVRAGVWPDDTPEFVTVTEPVLHGAANAELHITLKGNR